VGLSLGFTRRRSQSEIAMPSVSEIEKASLKMPLRLLKTGPQSLSLRFPEPERDGPEFAKMPVMEGPSLVIAAEEFAPFFGQKIRKAEGNAKLDFRKISGRKLVRAVSWGKHFLLVFEDITLRIHFLMFGSYRINNPRENRIPKMQLTFPHGDQIYFYSCAIKEIPSDIETQYDWSIDIMSKKWNAKKALAKIQKKPAEMVCDVLMDQNIFAGVGNIIKNEVLYNLKLHPETKISDLTASEQAALVKETRKYSLNFYKWKKAGVLKRHWQIFRRKECPLQHGPVIKRPTGKGERLSHYCEICQPLSGFVLRAHDPMPALRVSFDL
jgi:endonuclease-8